MHLTVHHIGYLVKKISPAIQAFEALGYTLVSGPTNDTIRQVDICFLKNEEYQIELVSPNSPDSVTAGLVKRYKNSPYHICYLSKDLNADMEYLVSNGYTAIDTPTPAPALQNKKVVFLMNAYLGMIELLEQ